MNNPLVGIIMGSDSDLTVMSEAAKVLEEFGVPYEISVVSAHRTPDRAHEYARTAKSRGLEIIIAGAGGAAHLAGVMAAGVTIPVIAVPVKASSLDGLDSLLSTAQMPPGVPVATVGINAAKNAGLLAVQILALKDADLANKLARCKKDMADKITEKAQKLESQGFKEYLKNK